MRTIVFLISLLSVGIAQAGYECATSKGDKVTINDSFQKGVSAQVISPRLTDFYNKTFKVKIKYLESTIDPDTNKYLTETEKKGYVFGLQADDTSVIGSMWSLEFQWTSGTTAQARLMDYEGNGLEFDLKCSTTGSLE